MFKVMFSLNKRKSVPVDILWTASEDSEVMRESQPCWADMPAMEVHSYIILGIKPINFLLHITGSNIIFSNFNYNRKSFFSHARRENKVKMFLIINSTFLWVPISVLQDYPPLFP